MSVRTTVRLDEKLMHRVKRYALEHNKTLTAVIEESLQKTLLEADKKTTKPFRLTTHKGGGVQPGVNLDDNSALLDILDGHDASS